MEVLVFSSNTAGIHNRGSAFLARLRYGAQNGLGSGLQGQSYAIPIRDARNRLLPLRTIKKHVDDFIQYAKDHPNDIFKVTKIGVGLNSYKHDDIGPMFAMVPSNCIMPTKWQEYLDYNEEIKYWNC